MIVSQQALVDSVGRCPKCGSDKVHRYSPINLGENLLSLIGITPHQCTHYTCQHRFYRRLKKSSIESQQSTITCVSDRLYGHLRHETEGGSSRFPAPQIDNLTTIPQSEILVIPDRHPPVSERVSNVHHYDFRSPSSVICRKFLTLTWREGGTKQSHTIGSENKHGFPTRVHLGRDPSRCDLVFADQTVSALHAEIYFDDDSENFYLRNLRPANPPFLNDRKVVAVTPLARGVVLYLGKVAIAIEIESEYYDLEPTILFERDEHSA